MNEIKLFINYCDMHQLWFTTDDNYDGAPDAGKQLMGRGESIEESIKDYFDQRDELNDLLRCPGCGEHGVIHKDASCVLFPFEYEREGIL